MADPIVETSPEPAATSPYALLFELETVAVAGRGALFDVLSGLLGEHKIELSAVQFARFAVHPSPARYMKDILEITGARKLSADKLTREVQAGLSMYFASSEAVLNPVVDGLLQAAQARGIPAAALSAQPASAAEALLAHLGLAERGVELLAFEPTDEPFPRADHWLKMAKSLQQNPRNCTAFAGSMTSCKAALSAGLHCVAMPDAFTSHQDFGGTDLVLEEGDQPDPAALVNDLFPELARI